MLACFPEIQIVQSSSNQRIVPRFGAVIALHLDQIRWSLFVRREIIVSPGKDSWARVRLVKITEGTHNPHQTDSDNPLIFLTSRAISSMAMYDASMLRQPWVFIRFVANMTSSAIFFLLT